MRYLKQFLACFACCVLASSEPAPKPPNNPFRHVDALHLKGDQEGALLLLSSQELSGKAEIERLVRLAALHLVENPEKALSYLNAAIAKDPDQADLRTYKASLLESSQKLRDAEAEYILAVHKEGSNPFMREQLADFYIRSSQYPKAMQVLEDTLSAPSSDSIWLKALFWSRMLHPLSFPVNIKHLPQGELAPFVAYLSSLLPGVYWHHQAFEALVQNEAVLNTRQEAFWLRLIDALKRGDEKLAYELLNYNHFYTVSWAPDIEDSLKTILTYRLAQLPASSGFLTSEEQLQDPQQFVALLVKYAKTAPDQLQRLIPAELYPILMSQDVFLIPFLTHGWKEAALQLNAVPVVPDAFPDWVVFALVQALQENRNDALALEFALNQKKPPALTLHTAKLALSLDRKLVAVEQLLTIFKLQDPIGLEASSLVQPILHELGQWQLAKEAIRAHPEMVGTIWGREKLARLALEAGDLVEATFLYSEIESYSDEAKSFLASKAFKEQNWERARKLTEELQTHHPDNETLKANLKAIQAQMGK